VDALIKENHWIMVSDIALTLGMRYGSACVTILNNLDYHKVCKMGTTTANGGSQTDLFMDI
jgi:hypothetical protein